MAAADTSLTDSPALVAQPRSFRARLGAVVLCVALPVAVWLYPFAVPANTKLALAIAAFMIVAWMTEIMDYSASGLIGLLLFWALKVAKPDVVFEGFVDPASWYYFGAVLIGAMATKSGLPQRIAAFVVARVGLTYSSLLLGLIIIDFLLTFIVPSGVARIVIMAPLCIAVINLFGAERGSNIGRGIFLVITYSTAVFDKMIIAGTGAITARGVIERVGGVDVHYSFWLIAFLPCSLLTILAGWQIALRMFPPEIASLAGRRDEVAAKFRSTKAWTPLSTKATILIAIAITLWLTDGYHNISAAMVAFGVGLIALLPFVDVLDADDVRKANLLPFFFVAAALGMSQVLAATGALKLLTDFLLGGMEPLLANRLIAVPVLYWTAFVYHFFTASEISMLATSLPVLMEFSKLNHLDPLWIGMVWSFGAGGKLFAYQSAVLIVGYAYGYFRHTDLIKIGTLLTIVEFLALTFCVTLYWPLLGF